MKKKFTKKMLAVFLSVCLLYSIMPAVVMANENNTDSIAEEMVTSDSGSTSVSGNIGDNSASDATAAIDTSDTANEEMSTLKAGVALTSSLTVQGTSNSVSGNDITDAFTDTNFLAAVRDVLGKDDSDRIYESDVANISDLDLRYDNISDLSGIEYFTSLTSLNCFYNNLSSLDISQNVALTSLNVGINDLVSLDVSNNTALTDLYCYANELTSLDVTNNTALRYLDCSYNNLSSIDLVNNTALAFLDCSYNSITNLAISNNVALTDLYCNDNELMSLDVSNNIRLTELQCIYNKLTSLDVSNNTALLYLYCSHNGLSSLMLANNTALIVLECSYNVLTSLDLSNNLLLKKVSCFYNDLTSLDTSNNIALTELLCYVNQLTSLDVSSNTALLYLDCSCNVLTSIIFGNNTALDYFDCSHNALTSLELSNSMSLNVLDYSYNYLTEIVGNNLTNTIVYEHDYDRSGYKSVTYISNIPHQINVGETINLSGLILPSDAENQVVTWSINETDTEQDMIDASVLNGNTLTVSKNGGVFLTATISNGIDADTDYEQEYYLFAYNASGTTDNDASYDSSSNASSNSTNENHYYSSATTTNYAGGIQSTIGGNFGTYSVINGAACETTRTTFYNALGAFTDSNVRLSCVDSECGNAAKQSIYDEISMLSGAGIQAELLDIIDIYAYVDDLSVLNASSPIRFILNLDDTIQDESKDFEIVLVQSGGAITLLPDIDEDPSTVTFDTPGFGVFALIEIPAGMEIE